MDIRGVENLSRDELQHELANGARLVFFEYCVSLLVVTARRTSPVHFLRRGEFGLIRGLPYTLLTLLLGWWGIPWGLIYTPLALVTNLRGGRDVTLECLEALPAKGNATD
jgi:hypothetical protein